MFAVRKIDSDWLVRMISSPCVMCAHRIIGMWHHTNDTTSVVSVCLLESGDYTFGRHSSNDDDRKKTGKSIPFRVHLAAPNNASAADQAMRGREGREMMPFVSYAFRLSFGSLNLVCVNENLSNDFDFHECVRGDERSALARRSLRQGNTTKAHAIIVNWILRFSSTSSGIFLDAIIETAYHSKWTKRSASQYIEQHLGTWFALIVRCEDVHCDIATSCVVCRVRVRKWAWRRAIKRNN